MNSTTTIMDLYAIRTFKSDLVKALITSREIIEEYGYRIICSIGIIINYVSLRILQNKQLKFKFYDFFRCRCFCNMLVCFFAAFTSPLYTNKQYEYWKLYLLLYFDVIPARVALLASFISDILLILNRVALLFGRKSSAFYTLSKKASLSLVY
jgi:hypothetical protein